MKVILVMAITVNGMIACEDNSTPFVSDNEWKHFITTIKKTGNYVMGRKTYEESKASGVFPYPCYNIVMTHQNLSNSWGEHVLFTAKTPNKIIDHLESKGHKTVLIGGGGEINSVWLQSGLVDEIYLDIEPTLLGKGIPLLYPALINYSLELLGVKKLSKNEIQLHYRICK